jgi:hypothetical protein
MKSETLRRILSLNSIRARRERGGEFVGRMKANDAAAFPYRMGAGYSGDVNRTHPFDVESCLIDSTAPPTFFGQGCYADAASPNGVRVPTTGDTDINFYGITVRPFPFQQQSSSNYGAVALGVAGTPPSSGIIDVLKSGYIIVTLQGSAAAFKGSAVFLCIIAGTSGVVGGFSAVAFGGGAAGTTVALTHTGQTYFNGPADPSGIVELAFNL